MSTLWLSILSLHHGWAPVRLQAALMCPVPGRSGLTFGAQYSSLSCHKTNVWLHCAPPTHKYMRYTNINFASCNRGTGQTAVSFWYVGAFPWVFRVMGGVHWSLQYPKGVRPLPAPEPNHSTSSQGRPHNLPSATHTLQSHYWSQY